MATPTIGGIMLASTHPERLHHWYRTLLPPTADNAMDQYRILDYGGFYLFIDVRDDIGDTNLEPGRFLINVMVDDARAVAARAEELDTPWIAPVEERDGSLFGTMRDPDGNAVQIMQLSENAKSEMAASRDAATV